MFKIKFLPARFGDAIWIEYGTMQAPHRLLIDGGTAGTRRAILNEFQKIPSDQRRLDLLVISHIDRDHIEGILGLLARDDPGFTVDDVWFNGWSHLPEDLASEDLSFGALQGEKLSGHLMRLDWSWNSAFNGEAVYVPERGPLPQVNLSGGMQITLLSPTLKALTELRPKWEKEVRDANLHPGFELAANDDTPAEEEVSFGVEELPEVEALAEIDYEPDQSEANASSIALMAEFDGKRVLLTADAHAETLFAALDRLFPQERIPIDLYKISHHGSKYTTRRELLEKVDCPRYVFSTNSSIFRHPDMETVARVVTTAGEPNHLIFNYHSSQTTVWDHPSLKEQYGYITNFPEAQEQGIVVDL